MKAVSPACLGTSGSVRQMANPYSGDPCGRRPHLLTVEHPLVAVADGLARQSGEVAPGAGFGEQLAAELVELEERPAPPLALFRRAELLDRRCDELARHGDDLVVARHLELRLEFLERRVVRPG